MSQPDPSRLRATTASATVSASIDHVWSVLTDHEGMSSWGPGVSVTLLEDGKPMRNGVGAVRRIAMPGPAPAIVEEVVTFDAPHRFGYAAVSGVPFRDYSGEVVLTEGTGGTRIDYTLRYRPRLPLIERVPVGLVTRALLGAVVRAART
ncbi:SRPBCC family protein [Nocardioidaceae bacterium]|nr:SRPBCC family protein [Nocardioidaceae bacterium]